MSVAVVVQINGKRGLESNGMRVKQSPTNFSLLKGFIIKQFNKLKFFELLALTLNAHAIGLESGLLNGALV